MRKYRTTDLPSLFQAHRVRIRHLAHLLGSLDQGCFCLGPTSEDELDPARLIAYLPLRLHALTWWESDPVEQLRWVEVPADRLLLDLAGMEEDPALASLAVLLLGIRHRGGGSWGRSAIERNLSAGQVAIFHAGLAHCPSPCLWALAHASGLASLLPDLSHLPETDLLPAARACERLALLFGVPAALTVLEGLALPCRKDGASQQRLRRFRELVQARQRGRHDQLSRGAARGGFTEEAALLEGLDRLDEPGHGPAEDLTDLFLQWMSDPVGNALRGVPQALCGVPDQRPISRRQLVKLARKALPEGLPAVAQALCRAWEEKAQIKVRVAGVMAPERQQACLALHLTFPGARLAINPELTPTQLDDLRQWLAGARADRVALLWSLAEQMPASDYERGHFRTLLDSDLPVELIRHAQQLDLLHRASRFVGKPVQLKRYLDCTAELRKSQAPLQASDSWFVSLFLVDRAGRLVWSWAC